MKAIRNWLKRNWLTILDTTLCCIILVGFFMAGFIWRGVVDGKNNEIWHSFATQEAPESCALCGNGEAQRYHAPCLVNLSTGEIAELTVYDPDPQYIGEIAAAQRTGFAQLISRAGVAGLRDASNHTCHVTVKSENMETINPSLFCPDCRTLLASVATEGYVLLDLHSRDNIIPYELQVGAQYTIRDYTVTISYNDEWDWYEVEVQGNI